MWNGPFRPWATARPSCALLNPAGRGDTDQLLRYVADSTQGFTLMLAGLKAMLEHNIRLGLTEDRYPKGVEERVNGA